MNNVTSPSFWLTLFLSFPLATMTTAQEVSVSAGIFIGIINDDGKGPYQLILKEAAKRAGIIIAETTYPLKRAVKTFTTKNALAIYGMTDAVIEEIGSEEIITSYPLGVYKLFIFTRKGDSSISSYAQLHRSTVGGVHGYEAYYKELVKNNINIEYLSREESQLKKLNAGRINAIIGFMPDWIPYLNKLSYDPHFSIHVGYDYMTVWNTPEGNSFVDRISPALQGMHADGTLSKILGDRFMEFEYRATKKYEWVSTDRN